jgi:hypothetical protein
LDYVHKKLKIKKKKFCGFFLGVFFLFFGVFWVGFLLPTLGGGGHGQVGSDDDGALPASPSATGGGHQSADPALPPGEILPAELLWG